MLGPALQARVMASVLPADIPQALSFTRSMQDVGLLCGGTCIGAIATLASPELGFGASSGVLTSALLLFLLRTKP